VADAIRCSCGFVLGGDNRDEVLPRGRTTFKAPIREGKIIAEVTLAERRGLLEQLGLIPAIAGAAR
jgi:hypothetical protein